MEITKEQVIEHLGQMTVLEMVELTRELEERWGVSATPQVQVQALPEIAENRGADERTEFDVVLEGYGEKKINVIKTLRELVPGLGLKEAKELVEGAPKLVKEGVSRDEAEEVKRKIEEAGGTVTVQ